MKKYILLFIVIAHAYLLPAQTILQKADSLFGNKDYFNSSRLYDKALKKATDAESKYIYFQLGECYRYGNNYVEAKKWYQKAVAAGYDAPLAGFHMGEMLLLSGEYAEAKTFIEKFLETAPDNSLARIRLESCNLGLKGQKEKPFFEIKIIKELSSPSSDYGIAFSGKNKMVLASTRMEGSAKFDPATMQGYSDMYESTFDTQKWQWDKPAKLKGEINTKFNEGTFTFNSATNYGYYMQCTWQGGKKTICNIMSSHYNESTGTWEEPKLFEYNSPGYSTGHPALSSDGKTMYITSNMPGGYGGSDIYVMKKKGDKWSDPENLGATVNTVGEEVFPFISGDSLLVFASDGHPGFGGLDIFMCSINEGKFSKPLNMMQPVNSSADDFNLIFNYSKNRGFFCSNRTGGIGDDDIYSYQLIPVILIARGNVKDKTTGKNIENAVATFKGSDNSVDSVFTDSKGNYEFKNLKPNLKYTVRASKDGYLKDSKSLNVENELYSKTYSRENGFDLDFELIKITKEEVKIDNIYYDYNKWELRPEAKTELDKIVNVLKETPDVYVQISSHTDERGKADYNMELSQKRAQSVVDYFVENAISESRLIAKGYGFSVPVIKNAKNEDQHQQNRRTTFKIISAGEYAKLAAEIPKTLKRETMDKTNTEMKTDSDTPKTVADSLQTQNSKSEETDEADAESGQSANKYFIIAGSFPTKLKAEGVIKSMKKNGYPDAEIVGKQPDGKWRVAFCGFLTKDKAMEELNKIIVSNPSAWIFEKK